MPRKPNMTNLHYNDPFPTRLRELMDENKVNQVSMTKVLSLKNRQSVTGYIDGSTSPALDKVVAVAKYFNVSADYLLGLSDVKTSKTDIKSICEETGLSERAVFRLYDQKPHRNHVSLASLVDFLLCDDGIPIELNVIQCLQSACDLKDKEFNTDASEEDPHLVKCRDYCRTHGMPLMTADEAQEYYVQKAASNLKTILYDYIFATGKKEGKNG